MWDDFQELASGYLNWRTEEAKADATIAGQQQLNNTVEQMANVSQPQPLNSNQYANIMQTMQENPTYLVGGVLALAVVYLLAKK
ncbi:hypothetical protein [Colwellia sp. E150_009]